MRYLNACEQLLRDVARAGIDELDDEGAPRPEHAHVDVLAARRREAGLVGPDTLENGRAKEIL